MFLDNVKLKAAAEGDSLRDIYVIRLRNIKKLLKKINSFKVLHTHVL